MGNFSWFLNVERQISKRAEQILMKLSHIVYNVPSMMHIFSKCKNSHSLPNYAQKKWKLAIFHRLAPSSGEYRCSLRSLFAILFCELNRFELPRGHRCGPLVFWLFWPKNNNFTTLIPHITHTHVRYLCVFSFPGYTAHCIAFRLARWFLVDRLSIVWKWQKYRNIR